MKFILTLLLVCFAGFVFLAMTGMLFLGEIPVVLIFGWIQFLGKVLPHIQPSLAIMLEGIGAILVLMVGTHLFLRWLFTNLRQPEDGLSDRRQWKLRWTATGLMIFVLMFITSISMTGLIHQTGWLAHEPWLESSFASGRRARADMRAIGTALGSYQVDWEHFPVTHTHRPVALSDVGLPPAYYEGAVYDVWLTRVEYSAGGHSYVLRSYGKNRILGGGTEEFDDIVYSNGQFLVPDER